MVIIFEHGAASDILTHAHGPSILILEAAADTVLELLALLQLVETLQTRATSVGVLGSGRAAHLKLMLIYLAVRIILILIHSTLVAFNVHVVALNHRDQDRVRLTKLRQLFRSFHISVVEWILPLQVCQHFLIANREILHLLG
jgi:hypothetical protein